MTTLFDNPIYAGLYGDTEAAAHLSAEAEIAAMLRFEAALAKVQAAMGIIPTEAGPAISNALSTANITAHDLTAGTTSAGVPVPALVKALRSAVAAPHGQFVHWGATSQDVLDTGLALRLVPLLDMLEDRLLRIVQTLLAQAKAHARTPMAGRTRSQIATPTTLGLRIAQWTAPLARCQTRLVELRPRVLVAHLGGASGNLSILGSQGPEAADRLSDALGLGRTPKPMGTERDGFLDLAHWLSMVTGILSRMAGDLILSGRSEIAELTAGQGGGSSTMPQKSNPVLAETITALARQCAAQVTPMTQALAHHEDRDGAAWATEWTALPQMLLACGAALRHGLTLASSLAPNTVRMTARLAENDAVHAEAMAFALAEQIGLPAAQALMKQAALDQAATGGTLADHVATACLAQGVAAPIVSLDPMLDASEAWIARLSADLGKAL